MSRFNEDRYRIVPRSLDPVSAFRMFLLIVEAGLFATFLVDFSAIISGSLDWVLFGGWVFILAGFALFIFNALMTFLSLPGFLFVALPLSLKLYRKGADNPLVWMGMFAALSFFCVAVPAILLAKNITAIWSVLVFPIHGGLTGWCLWRTLFGKYFTNPEVPSSPN